MLGSGFLVGKLMCVEEVRRGSPLLRRELYPLDDARGTTKVVRLEQLQPSTHLLGKKITNIWKSRDHTTVMYAVKKIEKKLADDVS